MCSVYDLHTKLTGSGVYGEECMFFWFRVQGVGLKVLSLIRV